MYLRHLIAILLLASATSGCGGGSAPSAPQTGKTALLFGATFANLSGAKVIDLKATLPAGVTPILAAGSGRELEIGVNALYGIPPVAIMFGRYSATSRQVVMQAYVTNVGTDFINGNYARLTYNPSGTPVLTNISTAVSAYGTGASNLTGQAVKTVTATTY